MSRIITNRLKRFITIHYVQLCLCIGTLFVLSSAIVRENYLGKPHELDISKIETNIETTLEQTTSLCEQWLTSKNNSAFISNLWKLETPSNWEAKGISIYIYKKDSMLLWSNHLYTNDFDPNRDFYTNKVFQWYNNIILIRKFAYLDKSAVVVLNLHNKLLGLNPSIFEDMQLDILLSSHALDGTAGIPVESFYVKAHIRDKTPSVLNIMGWIGLILITLGLKRFFRIKTKINNSFIVNFGFLLIIISLSIFLVCYDLMYYNDTVFNREVFNYDTLSVSVGELVVLFSLFLLYAVYVYRVRHKLALRYKQLSRSFQWALLLILITFVNISVVLFHYSMVNIIYHTDINIEIYKFTLVDWSTIFFYLIAAFFVAARILINSVVNTIFKNFNGMTLVILSVVNITFIILPVENAIINTGYILLIFHVIFLLLTTLVKNRHSYNVSIAIVSIFSIYIIFFSTIESSIADEKNAHTYARKLAYEASTPNNVTTKFQKMTYYKISDYKLEVKEDNSFDLQQLTRILSLGVDTTVVVGGYTHYVHHARNNETVVISRPTVTVLDYIAFFVYIFFLIYIVSGLILRFAGYRVLRLDRSRYALRIRLVVIGVVIFTMILVMVVITVNTFDNYENVNRKFINNHTQALLNSFDQYAKNTKQDTEQLMVNWFNNNSVVIGRNVVIYDADGDLLASSLIKPAFDKMNSSAYSALKWNKSHFFNKVMNNRGLMYNSAFVPAYHNDTLMGYINVIKMNKVNEKSSDSRFDVLTNILNILMVVVFVAILLSVLLYRMLTSPLNKLYQGMGNISALRKIEYSDGDDEIAVLTRQYNRMIDYLEESYAALARSEREDAWREMARQVSHEIKNPLTPMKLKIQMLQRAKSQGADGLDERIDSTLELLLEHIDLLAKIATEFSDFSKMDDGVVSKVSVEQLLNNVCQLYENEHGLNVTVKDVTPEMYIMVDYTQIARVFINLCQNAVQAISDRPDGSIVISTKCIDNKIYISVTDNGSGISDAARKRIFEPHFTTKSSGSGLGLAMSRQIVINFGGAISFESDCSGTTFTVELPLAI